MEPRRVLPSVVVGLVMVVFATSAWWLFRPQGGGPDRRGRGPLLGASSERAETPSTRVGPFVRDETTVAVDSGVSVFVHSNTSGPGNAPDSASGGASSLDPQAGPPDDGACPTSTEGLGALPSGDSGAP